MSRIMTTHNPVTAIVARLEAATEGSRELDRAILAAFGYTWRGMAYWADNPERMWKGPTHFTTNLDAVMTLVPEDGDKGRCWEAWRHGPRNHGAQVYVAGECYKAWASTVELALCIAALRARTLSEQSSGRTEAVSKPPHAPGERAGWCVHYTAPPRDLSVKSKHICAAGVDVRASFSGTKFDQRPCFLDKQGRSKPGSLICEHQRRPTSEEIALYEEWLATRMKILSKVMTGIAGWRAKHKGKSFGEVVECPACSGRLHLSIAAYNGHVHGHCETAGCVSWME